MAQLWVQFLDVGMGDSTLVIMESGGTVNLALVDFGIQPFTKFKISADDAMVYLVRTIAEASKGKQRPTLDHLFITHPDQDHYNRIPQLVQADYPGFPTTMPLHIGRLTYGGSISNYPNNFISDLSKYVDTVDNLVSQQHSDVEMGGTVEAFASYAKGDIQIYLLSSNVPAKGPGKANPKSLCLMFANGDSKVILMGDAEEAVEKKIVKWFENADAGFLNAYALKLGHHGSKNGTKNAWLDAVEPKAVFASGDMVWAHPYCETINRVIAKGTLAPTSRPLRYCCGISKENYVNTERSLKIGLNLWYVVQNPAGERMKADDGTNQIEFTKQGVTFGVQWELFFKADGATPELTKTPSASPV